MSIDTKIDTKTAPRLPAELVASSLFLLKRLGFAAKQRSLDEYEQTGLGPYHHAILILLDEGAPETQAAIADSLGYDRGTLVGLLDELEEQGLVERKRDPDDRRRHVVRLTADGKRSRGSHVLDRGPAQALLDDDRVLMLAQQLLQDAGVGEEPLPAAALRRGELGGVARALERYPDPVDPQLVRSPAEPVDEL